jgi:hypothetical protein
MRSFLKCVEELELNKRQSSMTGTKSSKESLTFLQISKGSTMDVRAEKDQTMVLDNGPTANIWCSSIFSCKEYVYS